MSFIFSLDMRVLLALYAVRDVRVTLAAIWLSELGEWYTIIGLAVALALWLALRNKFAFAQGVLLAVATSGITTYLLKSVIARPRPPEQYWAYIETWYSFPSAHAAMSLAFYGFVAWMVWTTSTSRLIRYASVTGLSTLILIIGFCRLYLGVHYLSDVIGGYILGAPCLWLAIWTTRALRWRPGVSPTEDLVE